MFSLNFINSLSSRVLRSTVRFTPYKSVSHHLQCFPVVILVEKLDGILVMVVFSSMVSPVRNKNLPSGGNAGGSFEVSLRLTLR